MDRGAWWATAHGISESDMTEQLSRSLSLSLFTCGYRSESGVVKLKNVYITVMNPSSEAQEP